MAGRFLIPVSRFNETPISRHGTFDGIERFPADTLAIPTQFVFSSYGNPTFEVERFQNFRFGLTRPRYRVSRLDTHSHSSEELAPTRLELVPTGHRVLLEVPSRRIQMTMLDEREVRHAAQTHSSGITGYSQCDRKLPEGAVVTSGTPDCPACLAEPRTWVLFVVQPYTHPRERKKIQTKEEKRQAEYDRRPSLFDRLTDDTYLDPDIPEATRAVFVFDPETVDETEDYEGTGREAKLASAREAHQRFKAEKTNLRDEIRASRGRR